MIRYIIYFFLFIYSFVHLSANTLKENSIKQKELIIAQMNYCINSLTNIIQNNSMEVLDYELNQLLNNLTITELVGIEEVADFRITLLQNINSLQITNEERALIKQIRQKNINLRNWESVSTAFNHILFIMPVGANVTSFKVPDKKTAILQSALLTLFTTTRTVIEYKKNGIQENINEMKQLWELRKNDLNTIAAQRKCALELMINLYQKYNLNEKDRLTEETCKRFNDIITTEDPFTRIRRLEDEKDRYSTIMDYYYHLGMAYIDANDYASAKPNLNKYLQMYQNAPIFRYDEKSGCIALAMLLNEKNLTRQNSEHLIKKAITNLPNNGAALIQCAMYMMIKLNNKKDAYNLLRSGIDKINITDKDLIIDTVITLLDDIKSYPNIYKDICNAIEVCNDIALTSKIAYLLKTEQLDDLSNIFLVSNVKPEDCFNYEKFNMILNKNLISGSIPFYNLNTFESSSIKSLSQFYIIINDKYRYTQNEIEVYSEKYDEQNLKIIKNTQFDMDALTKADIYDDLDFLKYNDKLFFCLFDRVGDDIYKVKKTIDIKGLSENNLSSLLPGIESNYIMRLEDNEKKELLSFLKEYQPSQKEYTVIKSTDETGWFTSLEFDESYQESFYCKDTIIQSVDKSMLCNNNIYLPKCHIDFYGDNLTYKPIVFYNTKTELLKFKFNGVLTPVITFVKNDDTVELYSLEYNNVVYYTKLQNVQFSKFIQEHNALYKEKNDTISMFEKVTDKLYKMIEGNESNNEEKENSGKKDNEDSWYKFW